MKTENPFPPVPADMFRAAAPTTRANSFKAKYAGSWLANFIRAARRPAAAKKSP